MAALLLHPPIHCRRLPPSSHFPPIKLVIKSNLQRRHKPTTTIAAAAGLVRDNSGSRGGGEQEFESIDKIKAELHQALQGIDRGIFGVTSAKKSEIESIVELLESQNPTPNPIDHLSEKVDGCWKLVYSTITILGAKRTKLGLRGFITLGDFLQIVDVSEGRAANVIKFSAGGFKMLTGQLTVNASFQIASKTRVDIKLENSSITPEQLFKLFQKNYELLLAIFNPEGWLEITYVDKSMRIGRDDKGNIFVLVRTEESS